MQKFFVEKNQIEGKKIKILGSDFNHIVNVLRKKKEDNIIIGNKDDSKSYIATIEKIDKECVILDIIEEIDDTVEANVEIDLYQGLPKFDKMELIIQKTIELGINSITPVDMSRCIVKLDEKDTVKKIDRWQKIAEGAAKQSKRGIIPEIKNKIKIKDIQNIVANYDTFIVAYEEEKAETLKQILKKLEEKENYKIGILVGPEGGITKEEVEILKSFGCKIVSLGKRILRTETAPIAMTSNILYELEK